MSRKLRVEVPGGFFHVISRGNDRAQIFFDVHDYAAYLTILDRGSERSGWRCHGYVVMPNHSHLVLETPEPSLAAGMRHVNGSYAQRLNLRNGRTGHVFESRYRSFVIEDDRHLLSVVRYVVLNPVRAGLCETPEEWPWSSHRATAGLEPPEPFLTLSLIHGYFAAQGRDPGADWAAFVAEAMRSAADTPARDRTRDLVPGPG